MAKELTDMVKVFAEQLGEIFVEVADTLVEDFDLIEYLQRVTTATSELFDARAAGLLLADQRGRLQLMAASDERAENLELFQVQADEGPCQDCYREGTPVVNADLRAATERWPQFAPRAVAAGYRSVHAFPLRLRGHVYGALNMFGSDVGDMTVTEARIVQALTDVATIGLVQQRTIRQGEALSEQLQGALNSRVVVEQAKGVLAQIHGTTPDQAFERLRSYSRSNRTHLSELAQAVVSDPASVPRLTTPRR
jgi:transcriptional regulator with GAF, ATPase, and Fis domain